MSATNMKLFLLLGFSLLLHHEIEGITTHSVTGCSDSVQLNCSITEMIHVERITYYNGTDCNQTVTDLQVCGQPMTGSDTGLVPSCNGKISCREHVYSYCPGSKAAKLDYRCIPGNNVKDMCDEMIVEHTNRIFLSTPNYPSSPTFTDISPCRCSIRASSITSIQILELLLRSTSDGTESSLEINYGDGTYKTESFSGTRTRMVYNKRLSTTASTTAEITLNHNNINRQYMWTEIQGVSIRVSCNEENNETKDVTTSSTPPRLTTPTSSPTTSSSSPSLTITTSSPPTSTTSSSPYFTTPTSPTSSQSVSEEPNIIRSSSTDSSTTTHPPQTADIKSHSQDKDTTIIILAVSLSLMMCITAIIIIIIIIIVLLRRKKLVWVKKPPQVERERSPYSGLDLDQRVAGPAGTYQELNTRNLRSPQVERERSPYSGLDLNQRVAGNDGTYQELNTRNSTPQYNNVSQNTRNDYYNLK